MATLRKQNQNQKSPAEKLGTKAADPFAEKFNAAARDPNAGGFSSLPLGKWEALTLKGGILHKDGKTMGWIEFGISQEEGGHDGKTGRAFYSLLDANEEIQRGAEFLARNLADMNYVDPEKGITSLDEVESILNSIEEDSRWVIIEVKKSGQYTNIFLSSVMENQDEKPEKDAIPF